MPETSLADGDCMALSLVAGAQGVYHFCHISNCLVGLTIPNRFFNTVGSKEGWAPSSFVSSRTSRSGTEPSRRPEDYMDGEDLVDMKNSETLLTSATTTSLETGGLCQVVRDSKALSRIFGGSANDVQGRRLLMRMGWKDGQGIGPKTKRPAKLTDHGDSSSTLMVDSDTFLFAPKEVRHVALCHVAGAAGLDCGELNSTAQCGRSSRAISDRTALLSPRHQNSGGNQPLPCYDTDSDENIDSIGPKISYGRGHATRKQSKVKRTRKVGGDGNFIAGSIPQKKAIQRPGSYSSYISLPGFTHAAVSHDATRSSFPPPSIPIDWTAHLGHLPNINASNIDVVTGNWFGAPASLPLTSNFENLQGHNEPSFCISNLNIEAMRHRPDEHQTRTSQRFHPSSILCKRFGVRLLDYEGSVYRPPR
jgi:hypothetical protein